MSDKNYKGHIAMLIAGIIWGLNAPIGKAVLESGITAFSLTAFRMIGGAAAFWIASFFIKKEHVKHEDMLKLFFAALMGVMLNQGSFIFGLSLTSPVDASIIVTTAPIFAMIAAAIYLKEPVTGKKVLGVFIGAIGALILILSSRANTEPGRSSSLLGNLICLSAPICFAVYLALFKDLISRYSTFTTMKWMFSYAAICIIPFSYGDLSAINIGSITPQTFAGILFVVLGATFLAYICMVTGQKVLRPTLVSMYNYVQPVVASLVAISLGMDTFGWSKIIAIILVFAGVYVVTQSKSKAQIDAFKEKQKEQNQNPS